MESVKTRLVKSAASSYSRAHRQTFYWTVNPRMAVGSLVDQLNVEGNAVSLAVTASESGATLTFSATGLPTGLSINASTGVIAGTVATGASAHGPYQTVVTASDGTYSTATAFGWTIRHANNIAPVLANPGMQANAVGDSVTMALTASDANGDALSYSAGGLPDGLYIDPTSGVISGTIYESALTTVPYAVTVTVDDGNGGSATQTFSWIVNNSALAVTAATLTATAGTTTGNVTVASFTNSDPNWSSWQFAATINWGDGTSSDVGAISGGNGSFTVSGSHIYARAGSYATSVAIADGFQIVTSAGSLTVSAAPIVVSGGFVQGAAVGIEMSATLASFTGNASALASGFIATISWGDTTSSVGTITGINGKFVVNGKHTHAATGAYTVNVSVTDLDASTGSATSTVQVGDVLAGIPATLTVATFRSNDPNAAVGQFTATINWGDTTSSSGTITALAGGVYTVTGTHKYAADGVYTVTTTVFGPYSESITASRSVTAKAPALTGYAQNLAATAGVAFSNQEVAEFVDPNWNDTAGMFSALINWGDGTSSNGTVSGANGVFEVLGGHQYATAGSYAINVLVQQLGSLVNSTLSTSAVLSGYGYQPNTVSGTVVFDANNQGATYAEPGLVGVWVVLCDANENAITSVPFSKTDSRGHFSFNNVAAGEYVVKLIAPDGYAMEGSGIPTWLGDFVVGRDSPLLVAAYTQAQKTNPPAQPQPTPPAEPVWKAAPLEFKDSPKVMHVSGGTVIQNGVEVTSGWTVNIPTTKTALVATLTYDQLKAIMPKGAIPPAGATAAYVTARPGLNLTDTQKSELQKNVREAVDEQYSAIKKKQQDAIDSKGAKPAPTYQDLLLLMAAAAKGVAKTGIQGIEAQVGGSLAEWIAKEGLSLDTSKIKLGVVTDFELNKNWKQSKLTIGPEFTYGTTSFGPTMTIGLDGKPEKWLFTIKRKF